VSKPKQAVLELAELLLLAAVRWRLVEGLASGSGNTGHSFGSRVAGWLRVASMSRSVRLIGLLFSSSFVGLSSSDPSAMCPFFTGGPQSRLSVGPVVSSPSSWGGGAIDVSGGIGGVFPVALASSGTCEYRQT